MSNLRKLFTPEQFRGAIGTPSAREYCSETAHAILNEALDKAVRVYGYKNSSNHWVLSDYQNRTPDTHQALLVAIEEISKKQCEHEPHEQDYMDHKAYRNICKHCGAKLKAKWEAV